MILDYQTLFPVEKSEGEVEEGEGHGGGGDVDQEGEGMEVEDVVRDQSFVADNSVCL